MANNSDANTHNLQNSLSPPSTFNLAGLVSGATPLIRSIGVCIRSTDGSRIGKIFHLCIEERFAYGALMKPTHAEEEVGCNSISDYIERYALAIKRKQFRCEPIIAGIPYSIGINLFREETIRITEGISLSFGHIYCIEQENINYAYSVRMRLDEDSVVNGSLEFAYCQLVSRQWKFKSEGENDRLVEGDGVIGYFPILYATGHYQEKSKSPMLVGDFVYSSCTGPMKEGGGVEGGFTFISYDGEGEVIGEIDALVGGLRLTNCGLLPPVDEL